jgi:hypothetical protein
MIQRAASTGQHARAASRDGEGQRRPYARARRGTFGVAFGRAGAAW